MFQTYFVFLLPRISHFFKEPWFLLLGNGMYRSLQLYSSQRTEIGNSYIYIANDVDICTNPHMYLYLFLHLLKLKGVNSGISHSAQVLINISSLAYL